MIKKFSLQKLDFLKDVSVLLGGAFIYQLTDLLSAPLIAKLYTPQDFATLALFISTFSLIKPIMTGRLEFALLSESNNDNAEKVSLKKEEAKLFWEF